MKHQNLCATTVLGVAILATCATSFGQGSFAFDNAGGNGDGAVGAIYGPDPSNPNSQKWGNTPDGRPPGTQVYGGMPLAGTNYSVQAWYSLAPVAGVFQLAGDGPVSGPPAYFNLLVAGYFAGSERAVPGALTIAYLQVRVWDNAGGQLVTWDEAWEAALGGSGLAVGWSKVFEQELNVGLVPRPGMENFESFNIFIVPEPGTIGLTSLGGVALLMVWRRRRHGSCARN